MVEGGDEIGEEQMLNCFCKDWTLVGSGRNGYQLSANLQGGTVTPAAFTGDPGLISHSNMNFGMTKFYIDAVGETGAPGITQVSNTVRGLNFKYKGFQAKDTADGRLDYSFAQEDIKSPPLAGVLPQIPNHQYPEQFPSLHPRYSS